MANKEAANPVASPAILITKLPTAVQGDIGLCNNVDLHGVLRDTNGANSATTTSSRGVTGHIAVKSKQVSSITTSNSIKRSHSICLTAVMANKEAVNPVTSPTIIAPVSQNGVLRDIVSAAGNAFTGRLDSTKLKLKIAEEFAQAQVPSTQHSRQHGSAAPAFLMTNCPPQSRGILVLEAQLADSVSLGI